MRTLAALAAAGLLTLTLAACTASGPAGTAAGQPANPVPILKLTRCPVPPGETSGTAGADSNRVATGTFPGGAMITVLTYPDVAYRDNRLAHPLAPLSDGSYRIKGPGASIIVIDMMGAAGPTARQVAVRVHGTVIG